MHALVLNSFDGPSAVTFTEVDAPMVADGEVLVRVDAAAVGPWDPQTTLGYFAAAGGMATFPQILGWDLSGMGRKACSAPVDGKSDRPGL
jgi:NADPH:quinone reductase-like Zn-dependent oxidoreductase